MLKLEGHPYTGPESACGLASFPHGNKIVFFADFLLSFSGLF